MDKTLNTLLGNQLKYYMAYDPASENPDYSRVTVYTRDDGGVIRSHNEGIMSQLIKTIKASEIYDSCDDVFQEIWMRLDPNIFKEERMMKDYEFDSKIHGSVWDNSTICGEYFELIESLNKIFNKMNKMTAKEARRLAYVANEHKYGEELSSAYEEIKRSANLGKFETVLVDISNWTMRMLEEDRFIVDRRLNPRGAIVKW